MIRHIVTVTKAPIRGNILSVLASSQYTGRTPRLTARHHADPHAVDSLLAAAGNMSISGPQTVYKLPQHQRKTAVLDPKPFSAVQLPSGLFIPKIEPSTSTQEISAPSREKTEKSCKSDLKQRRRHMNKHKLKKLRKRMKFVYLRLAQKKAKRKAILLKQECDEIVNSAKKWDPLVEIQKDIEMARKGGFGIDVFEKKNL